MDKVHKRQSISLGLQAAWRAHSEQLAHDQTQVSRRNLQQISLGHLGQSSQPTPPRSARLAHMGEAPFGQLASPALQPFATRAAYPAAIAPHCRLLLRGPLAPLPMGIPSGFGNIRSHTQRAVQQGQGVRRMITFVGRRVANVCRTVGLDDVELRLYHALGQRLGVATIGFIYDRRQHQIRFQIDDVFCLVGQMRPAVLHLRNAAVGIGGRLPIVVGDLLLRPCFVESPQIFVGRVLDAGLCGQSPEILFPILTRVLPLDALHCRVGLQQRRIDGHRRARKQLLLRGQLEHKVEHRGVDFLRKPLMNTR